jgi:Arc/MetJ family transcription regulator
MTKQKKKMRTNISVDAALLQEALQLSGLPNEQAVVEAALQEYVQRLHQQQLKALKGQLKWEGNLEDSRTNLS